MPSAVIVRARLPAGLERLRRAHAHAADAGVPAHLTMLYPFAERADLTTGTRRTLTRIAQRHEAFEYELSGMAKWPDTIYVAVQPDVPFLRLQRDLQGAFPDFPIYGRDSSFRFVPHVTIAEGQSVDDPSIRADRAWRVLPRSARGSAIEVIATGSDGRWRLVWRIPLMLPDSRGAASSSARLTWVRRA